LPGIAAAIPHLFGNDFQKGKAAALPYQKNRKNLACDRENSDIIEDFQLVAGLGRR
jgi:hypothetical protein